MWKRRGSKTCCGGLWRGHLCGVMLNYSLSILMTVAWAHARPEVRTSALFEGRGGWVKDAHACKVASLHYGGTQCCKNRERFAFRVQPSG